MESYRTVKGESTGVYEEKRSRFIAALAPVQSEEEAVCFIAKIKENNREARHNVHAFVIKENGISRFSDDGEPHGTAGKPILDIINGAKLKNVCLVVTRYFGGILLGTGGLCRAYSAAAKAAVESAQIVTMEKQKLFCTFCDYSQYNRFVPFVEKNGGIIKSTEFSENVKVIYALSSKKSDIFLLKLEEMFSGKLNSQCIEEIFAENL